VVAENQRALGVIYLKDIVKGGMRERFNQLRAMGIKTVMITGDNPLTAAAIAREAGVDNFLAEATPKDKMDLIRREQGDGKLVAMTGDGTNDAPALAQADVGVAMNTGTQAAKEAGNMVDLDSNPTKLIEVVAIGKQLLMTRGALAPSSGPWFGQPIIYSVDRANVVIQSSEARDLQFAAKCRSLASLGMTKSGELKVEERGSAFATDC
jgi:potassium-transporting ATPase ATP-binding subunit